MKAYIHILNYNDSWDDSVSVKINIPFIPVKGNYIWLSDKDEKILEDKARKDLISYSNYLYGKSYKFRNNDNVADLADPEDLSFGDCIVVYSIMYNTKNNTIHIELYNGNESEYI